MCQSDRALNLKLYIEMKDASQWRKGLGHTGKTHHSSLRNSVIELAQIHTSVFAELIVLLRLGAFFVHVKYSHHYIMS